MPVLDPHPEHFRRAVVSVLEQSMADWELIIVEDPSATSGRDLLASIRDNRVRHVCNPERTSFAAQLNQGLHLARARWVARFDADDLCLPERLEQQLNYLAAHPEVEVLGSRIEMIDKRGNSLGFRNYPLDHDEIVGALPRFNPLAHPSVMFDREKMIEAGGYTADMYSADYDLWSRLAQSGARFANHPGALVRYRIHAQGMKSARLRAMLQATLEVKSRYWRQQMDFAARWRMRVERMLLCLPPELVLKLFLRTNCQSELEEAVSQGISFSPERSLV